MWRGEGCEREDAYVDGGGEGDGGGGGETLKWMFVARHGQSTACMRWMKGQLNCNQYTQYCMNKNTYKQKGIC